MSGLGRVVDRLQTLAQAVGDAEVDDAAPIDPEIAAELRGVAKLVGQAGAGAGVEVNPEVEAPIKAASAWSVDQVNALPDSSFLHVEEGGAKDGSGKTTPRALRHFAVRDANGKIDPTRLRDALAHIPQSGLPDGIRAEASEEAQRLLDGGTQKSVSWSHDMSAEVLRKRLAREAKR